MGYETLFQIANSENQTAKDYAGWGAVAGLGSTFSSLAGSLIDYGTLKTDASSLYVQAGEVQLQAKQRANQLREQFINATGSYMFGAAQRGIAVQSGSVQSNLKRSAENLGQDIATMDKNAELKASALRTQANIAMSKAKAMKKVAYANAISGVANSVAGMGAAWGTSGATATPQKVAPVPGKKPF